MNWYARLEWAPGEFRLNIEKLKQNGGMVSIESATGAHGCLRPRGPRRRHRARSVEKRRVVPVTRDGSQWENFEYIRRGRDGPLATAPRPSRLTTIEDQAPYFMPASPPSRSTSRPLVVPLAKQYHGVNGVFTRRLWFFPERARVGIA